MSVSILPEQVAKKYTAAEGIVEVLTSVKHGRKTINLKEITLEQAESLVKAGSRVLRPVEPLPGKAGSATA